jgi:hypothetical protein
MERRVPYQVRGGLFWDPELLEADDWSAKEREEAAEWAEWAEWARAYDLWLPAPELVRSAEGFDGLEIGTGPWGRGSLSGTERSPHGASFG